MAAFINVVKSFINTVIPFIYTVKSFIIYVQKLVMIRVKGYFQYVSFKKNNLIGVGQ